MTIGAEATVYRTIGLEPISNGHWTSSFASARKDEKFRALPGATIHRAGSLWYFAFRRFARYLNLQRGGLLTGEWAVTVVHRPEMTAADIHIMFIMDLPASKPQDKARFKKWLAWCDTPDLRNTIVREQQDQRQLGK